VRQVSHRRYRWVHDGTDRAPVQGQLRPFSRSLGLDVIITEDDRAVLIELQHGFGRRGLIELFPHASRSYRKTYWQLRRECGRNLFITEQLRQICTDKIATYRHFARHQPDSHVYPGWSSDVEQWLEQGDSALVLAKPPRGSCGAGIVVVGRRELLRGRGSIALGNPPLLLQTFVQSRLLADAQGQPHLGCIRHIVLLRSDGVRLGLVHLPPYWRVSPVPLSGSGLNSVREALTANISRGAYPLAVAPDDRARVRALAEQVVEELVSQILGLGSVPREPSRVIEADGRGGSVEPAD